jgi:transcriptional regulator with XRE-family HTH domain
MEAPQTEIIEQPPAPIVPQPVQEPAPAEPPQPQVQPQISEKRTKWHDIGARLQMLLDNSDGVTMVNLSDMVGCGYTTVRQWFSGDRKPALRFARRLAEIFGVSIKYINYGGPQPKSINRIRSQKRAAAIRAVAQRTTVAVREDDTIANAVEKAAEGKFLRGLRRIGLTDEQIEFALSSQQFKHENMIDTVNAVGGMIDRLLIDLMLEIRNLNNKINDETTPPEKLDEYCRRRASLHFDVAQFARISQNGMMMAAKVQQIWHEINGKKKSEKKIRTLDLDDPQ